jgi:tetratricopeptide (TPR) repeat protein
MFEASYNEAESFFNASKTLYQQAANKQGLAIVTNNLGIVSMYRGDYERARVLHEENLVLSRQGENPVEIASALGNLGDVLRYLQAHEQAQSVLAESLSLLRQINNKQALATTLYSLGRLAIDTNDLAAAAGCFKECLALYRETQDPVAVADVVEGVALLAGKRKRPFPCARLFGAAEAIRQLTGTAVPHCERAAHQQIQAEMVTAVGETAFQEARQRGRQLTLLEALAAAQSWLEDEWSQEEPEPDPNTIQL